MMNSPQHIPWVHVPFRWVRRLYDWVKHWADTPYAVPAKQLGMKSVRQRRYRGYCHSNDRLDATIAVFNDSRAAIEDLFSSATEQSRMNTQAVKYLHSFYETINDPGKRQKKILDACRGKKS